MIAMRTSMRMNSRPTVGLVLASLHTGASADVWPSVAQEAARADVNLFCFPGGRVGLREGHEASRNFVYELAASGPLDGLLLWSSSLSGAEGPGVVERFIDRFRDLPAVSLSDGIAGMPVVTIDYYGGMAEATRHAVEAHGYRSLAFIRGPEGHPGARERYRAFLDVLAAEGIEAEERLASSPRGWDAGDRAMLELLDSRRLAPGRDFRAIIAASDLMALGAVRVLQSRGYRIPEEVAVIGMNDSVESRLAAPPLTTVHGPFDELGAEALRSLLAAVRGEAIEPVRRLPATLVLRRSCGCPSRSFLLAREEDEGKEGHPDPVEDVLEVVGGSRRAEREWVEPLVEAWHAAVEGPGAGGASPRDAAAERLYDLLGRVADRLIRAGADLGAWQGAVSVLRRASLAGAGEVRRRRVEDLAGRARVLVAEAAERAAVRRAWEEERQAEELRSLDHELLMTFDMDRLRRTLRETLPRLGLPSAYVCLYGEEEGRATLAFALRDGEELAPSASSFPAGELVPPEALPRRRLAFVVEPLFFHETRIGHALFEIGPGKGALYEELRDTLSGALRSVILFARAEEARERAERADETKTQLLSNVSHELRAPVGIVLGCLGRLEASVGPAGPGSAELARARAAAEHQLGLVNDLLDLSRAEMDELDVNREPTDLGPILRDALADFASGAGSVEWRLDLPERLPLVLADRLRIKQVLYNLLGNARKFTDRGFVELSAEVAPPELVVSVRDTGRGIARARLGHLFEPFVSASASGAEGRGGAGLGLSIARHLVALHFGSIEVESEEGVGSTFRLRLPLPSLEGRKPRERAPSSPCLLVISPRGEIDPEIAAVAARRGLEPRRMGLEEVEEGGLEGVEAAAIAWDLSSAGGAEWSVFRKVRQRPSLAALPFLLYGAEGGTAAFVPKGPAAGEDRAGGRNAFLEAIMLSCPPGGDEPVLVADDDAEAREALRETIRRGFPDVEVVEAADGAAAWELLRSRRPRLAILDVVMPGLGGIELVERIRADARLAATPVLLLTNKVVTMEDVRRLEGHSRVLVQNKGIWGEGEARSGIARLLYGEEGLPAATSSIVRRTVAFLDGHYASAITRWKLAEAVNASEDYVSRVFHRELGLTPWEYLTRLRVQRAKELLRGSSRSVAAVAREVGFSDQAYFSRVFRKATGSSPQAFRDSR